MRKQFVGFKGERNASCVLVRHLSESFYLLTNSSRGIRIDIEQPDDAFEYVLMFGIDSQRKDSVRIEEVAELEQCRLTSNLDLIDLSKRLHAVGIVNDVSNKPTHYLCNEAYWFALRKFDGRVAFIHIPSLKNMDDDFVEKMKRAVG